MFIMKRKEDGKRKIGAVRHFKLDLRDGFLMILIYYRLYITYTLTGFLFDLDQRVTSAEIFKRLNIEFDKSDVYQFHIKTYYITKRLKTPEEVEKYFPGFLAFTNCTEQQIPRPIDKNKRKMYYSGKKKRHTTVKNQLMVNNRGYILHKIRHKKGRKHDYYIYKK